MRSLIATLKNSMNSATVALSALILVGTIAMCAPTKLLGDDPGGSSNPPEIDSFNVMMVEMGPNEYEYTFSGRVINSEVVEGQLIDIYGGPFSEYVTTDELGDFQITCTVYGSSPVVNVDVLGTVIENGEAISAPAVIAL